MEKNETTNEHIFERLFAVIESRKTASPDSSYTARLLHQGLPAINAKITEEAAEVVEAAGGNDPDHLIHEIADLFYHTLVLAAHQGVSLERIQGELGRRFGVSGLEEKAARKQKEK